MIQNKQIIFILLPKNNLLKSDVIEMYVLQCSSVIDSLL